MKKEKMINGRLYEVETLEQYMKNPDVYLQGYTAILDEDTAMVLPIVNNSSPGIIAKNNSPVVLVNMPQENERDEYSASSMIDYSKATDFGKFMEMQQLVRDIERDVLTSPDNIYVPAENPEDSPALRALKKAVIDKHIDIDKYEKRFGSNYNNDKRNFNKTTISLPMLVRMCNALDIKASLTLTDQDANGEIANPMNDSITVELTSGYRNDESIVGGEDDA